MDNGVMINGGVMDISLFDATGVHGTFNVECLGSLVNIIN